jgi:diguanylate cyclase (GGDEF)-like protein
VEQDRLAELHALDILDTEPEQAFDDVVLLAGLLSGRPTALISLVDAQRQWFKARIGLDVCSTDRDIAFCHHVVAAEQELEVPDARSDPRFRSNPLVVGPPHIVCYAGFPLVTRPGLVVGTLCVIGYEVSSLTQAQRVGLRALARQAVVMLQLRRREAEHATDADLRRATQTELGRSRSGYRVRPEHRPAPTPGPRVPVLDPPSPDPRDAIVQAARRIGGAASACLIEPDGDALAISRAVGLPLVATRIPFDLPSITANVWRSQQPVFVADPARHPMVNPALLALSHARSMLWQPILADGRIAAILAVTWDEPLADRSEPSVRAIAVLAEEAATTLAYEELRSGYEVLAGTDALTGLPNRRGWDARVAELVRQAERSGGPLVVALADLDHFKTYNDARGHLAGDGLLSELSGRLLGVLRQADLVARWGGEEFAFALPDCARPGADRVLDRLRRAVPAGQTVSVGAVEWTAGRSANDLVAAADTALYQAKRAGRNQVVWA